jgi:hypothetical protein
MKKQARKLTLTKETVRSLGRQEIETVAGGTTVNLCISTDRLGTYCCVSSGVHPKPGFCTGAGSCTC